MKPPSQSTKYHLLPFILLLLITTTAATTNAQLSAGADIMSRYVWRGFDYGNAVSIQPSLSYAHNGFEIGTWASYGIDAQSAGATEHDLWAQYSVDLQNGTQVELGITDYYFPNAGAQYFDWSDEGAHQIEPFITFTGPERLPVSVWFSAFIQNEPDNATYLEFSYPFSVDGVDLSVALGGAPTASDFYLNPDGPALTKASLSVTKDLPISETFDLPLSISYILNPHQETSFLVFGISI